MGAILGMLIIGALYLTTFLICKYKSREDFVNALDEIEKNLEDLDNKDK